MRLHIFPQPKLVVHALFAVAFVLGITVATLPAAARPTSGNETLFSIPVGDASIRYEGVGIPDALAWGPTAFAVAPDGSVWIADTAAQRVLHYTATGAHLRTIDTRALVVGVMDMEATSSELWLLDGSATTPTVVRLQFDGTLLRRYDVPAALHGGLTGIALGERGEVLLEREDGRLVDQLVDRAGNHHPQPLRGYLHGGHLYAAHGVDPATNDGVRGTLRVGATTIDIRVPHMLAGLYVLGVNGDASVYAVVSDMVVHDGGIHIDQTVHHYNANGQLLGVARVPLAEQYVPVPHALAVGPDDQVYVLVTRPDRVDVQRLPFSAQLAPTLPTATHPQKEHSETDLMLLQRTNPPQQAGMDGAVPNACVSRSSIIGRAQKYAFGQFALNATNLDGTCVGRGKPRFLDSAWPTTGMPFQYYVPIAHGPTNGGAPPARGMAYDWGGWDSIDGYQSYMRQGFQAGDINTKQPASGTYSVGVETCSRGVDCSGFVTRALGISSQKYSTTTLSNISTALPDVHSVKPGDLLVKPTRHSAVVDTISADQRGVWVYESTTFAASDRVIHVYHDWSYYNGYDLRRYTNLCDP